MKSILIPVDFTSVTENVLAYAASFCKDVYVEEIVLFKSFRVPAIAQLLPDANMVAVGNEQLMEETELIRVQLDHMATRLKAMVPSGTRVERLLLENKWPMAIEYLIEKNGTELVILGSDPLSENNDSLIAELTVTFSKSSLVPVLLVPVNAVYRHLKRILIPTSFENLDRLKLMEKFCISQAWLEADLLVLNVDPSGKYLVEQDSHTTILDEYFKNYHYQIHYSEVKHIVQEILNYAEEHDVQLIMALPGKHSFLHKLTHQSVTQTFALNASRPVLLLK